MKQSSGGGFTKDEKFLFVNVPNGKISSQHEMQYHRLIISLKVLIINVVQFIRFNMNPKLTDVTLSCTVFIINVNITDLAGENYIRIGRNTHQYLH